MQARPYRQQCHSVSAVLGKEAGAPVARPPRSCELKARQQPTTATAIAPPLASSHCAGKRSLCRKPCRPTSLQSRFERGHSCRESNAREGSRVSSLRSWLSSEVGADAAGGAATFTLRSSTSGARARANTAQARLRAVFHKAPTPECAPCVSTRRGRRGRGGGEGLCGVLQHGAVLRAPEGGRDGGSS